MIAPKLKVVDGQQRLVTLTILLAVLRRLTASEFADGLTDYLYQKGKLVEGRSNRYRLALSSEEDAEFFKYYVQEPKGLSALEDEKSTLISKIPDSQKHILENSLYFLQALREVPESKRKQLASFIATRCFLVVVSTPDIDSAYRIFSVLNARGLPLTLPDLLKAQILGSISEESSRTEYARRWETKEAELGEEPFQNLFSHIRMLYRKTKVRNALTEFKEYIRPADTPEAFVDDTLLPLANAYEDILDASYENQYGADQINALLKWLSRIDNSDWIPPAILYMKLYRNKPALLANFFSDLERLAAGLMLLRANINRRIERYGRLLNSIENGEDLYSSTSPLQLSLEEKSSILNVLDGDIYNFEQIRRFVLLRLDSALAGGGATYDQSIITVEHVLPQNPPEDSEWLEWFPEEQKREDFTHRLGNLALLPRRTNAAARNYSFDKKKRQYFQREGVANFALTNQVLNHEIWNPTIIEERQRDLTAKLAEIWNLE